MITISVNGTKTTLRIDAPLIQALKELEPPFAVALNKKFIPQSQYEKVTLQDGDNIEIVTPMQGG